MAITRDFNLYLNAGHSVPLVINVNQYDRGETWRFTLYKDDGTKYTPSTGAIVGIKSDGLGIINSGSVVDGKVVINETQQMTAAVGKATFELTIDGQTHGTANFIVLVEPKPGDNADLSESDLSLLQEAIDTTAPANIATAVQTWMDENLDTSSVVDSTLTISGAAADAKATGDKISDLKSHIDKILAFSPNLYNPQSVNTSSIINSSGGINTSDTYSDYVVSEFIDVSKFDDITVLFNKPWGIAFYDASKTFIERLTSTSATANTVYTLTRNNVKAYFIRICYNSTSDDYAKSMVIGGSNLEQTYVPYGEHEIIPTPNIVSDLTIGDYSENYVLFNPNIYDPVFYPPKVRQTAWRGCTYAESEDTGYIEPYAPANSWSAYQKAIDEGFDMLWIAVIQYSSDGTFYCFHDNTITIGGVTKNFYEFSDSEIQTYTLSDGSAIPLFKDVIKLCLLHGMQIGIRLGHLPANYTDTFIGSTSLKRTEIWNDFIDICERYDLRNSIYSGSNNQASILHSLKPSWHIQTTSSISYTESDLITMIDSIVAIGAKRCSVNVYTTNNNGDIILTEQVMEYARNNNVKVFAVTTEPIATNDEITCYKNLVPDYIVTHSKIEWE